jgi:hypothetical protein
MMYALTLAALSLPGTLAGHNGAGNSLNSLDRIALLSTPDQMGLSNLSLSKLELGNRLSPKSLLSSNLADGLLTMNLTAPEKSLLRGNLLTLSRDQRGSDNLWELRNALADDHRLLSESLHGASERAGKLLLT